MKLKLLPLLALFMAGSAMAAKVEIGDRYISKTNLKFLETDYSGVFNVADIFQKTKTLEAGYMFTVVDTHFSCKRDMYQGKMLDSCNRMIELEANKCGIENMNDIYEQITGSNFTLKVENDICTVRVYDKYHGTMFGEANYTRLNKSSKLGDYFVKIRN